MRMLATAGVLCLLVLAPLPPGRAEAFLDFQFDPARAFPAPDSLTYEIVGRGSPAPGAAPFKGEATVTTKKVTTGPFDKLTVTYTGTEPSGQQLDWNVTLEEKSLKPWAYSRLYTDERGSEQLDLTFADGMILLQLRQINGEQVTKKIPNIAKEYTLLPLLMLSGRGLEFATGNLFTTMFLDPDRFSFQTPIVSILGTELLTVPAGVYECWKVEYKIGSAVEYGYYAVKNPRIIARYETAERVYNLKKHAFIK